MIARLVLLLALPLAMAATLLVPATPAQAALLEDYAPYQPQTRCAPKAKPGTEALAGWIVQRYGGGYGGISRACSDATSEHHEGRAFDWRLDATTRQGRRAARAFLRDVLASDRQGREHAKARRMGIMYVIWDDRMWSAWDGFEPEPYLSSSCRRLRKCSPTLRHRDHVHISLSRKAGRGQTSWYDGRVPQE